MIHSGHLTKHSGLFSHLKESISKGQGDSSMGQEYAELAQAYQRNHNKIATLNSEEIAKTTLTDEQYQIHLQQRQQHELQKQQTISNKANKTKDDSILNGLLG
ncbi:MAG: hypothetical protein K2O85_09500 [Helicobacter sp.]|nr:hypothetical protein [Helicobacter sp.]MDE7317244.1 hypothetical protein [Helicobacter sp.]